MERTQIPMDRGMDKEDVVHIFNGILLSHQKGCLFIITSTWMGVEDIMLSKIWQWKKHNYHMVSLICQISEIGQRTIEKGKGNRMRSHQRWEKTIIVTICSNKLRVAGWGQGVPGWWALRWAHDAMSTWCYTHLIYYLTLHLNLMMYDKLANWI